MTKPFDDTPAPRHPQLEAMILAARVQAAPQVKLRFEDVDAAASRRSHRRFAFAAIAAGLIGVVAWASASGEPTAPRGAPIEVVDEAVPLPSRPVVPSTEAPEPTKVVALEHGATLEMLHSKGTSLQDLPRTLSVTDEAQYRVRTDAKPITLPIGAKVLEIEAASEVVIDTSTPTVSIEVISGKAAWTGSDDSKPRAKRSGESPADLAAMAEAAIVERKHDTAVRLLRKLAREYPSSEAAKAGLIDLARLERKLGRPARAHCAYAAFLRRFPSDTRAPAVRTADDGLRAVATTATCRGLEPSTK